MSALRRTLAWAFLAGMGFTAGEVLHAVHQRQPLPVAVRLVPDTLGVPVWPVIRQDAAGARCVIEWWPVRVQ